MSQLTANTPNTYEVGFTNSQPVLTNTEIFLGSAVGLSAGYARPLNAGDVFLGFAEQHINNNPGASGALRVPVIQTGVVQLAISGAAITDIGKIVYASDGATFTFTATSNSRIGTVVRWVSTGVVMVYFDAGTSKLLPTVTDNTGGAASTTFAAAAPSATLTDSTGGTASTTFAAITAGAGYAQADMVAVKNALSQVVLNINALNTSMTAVRNALAETALLLNQISQAGL